MAMSRARIVLAEDHPRVAMELEQVLAPHFDVVAVVSSGGALITTAMRLNPDVVVTDINMPGIDGMTAARELRSIRPSIGIVFVTVYDDPGIARKALAIGSGYVLKGSAGEELEDGIRAVLRGEVFVSRSLADELRRR
jgi:DNA-binding NarL/FixJ family response regulator